MLIITPLSIRRFPRKCGKLDVSETNDLHEPFQRYLLIFTFSAVCRNCYSKEYFLQGRGDGTGDEFMGKRRAAAPKCLERAGLT
jgi:hypothetical protein